MHACMCRLEGIYQCSKEFGDNVGMDSIFDACREDNEADVPSTIF